MDATARWRIVDALRFLQVIRDYGQAYTKLDDIIDSVVRDYVSANPLVELVEELSPFETAEFQKVAIGREAITRAILAEVPNQ